MGPIQYKGKRESFSVNPFVLAWSIMILELFNQLSQAEHSIFINIAVFHFLVACVKLAIRLEIVQMSLYHSTQCILELHHVNACID